MTVSKKELIERATEETGLKKKDVIGVVASLLCNISNELSDGGEVSIDKFGKFKVVERAERSGVNPKTHERIVIKSSKAIKFIPSSYLKNGLNK